MKRAVLLGLIATFLLAALLGRAIGPTVSTIATTATLTALIGVIWFVCRRRTRRQKHRAPPPPPPGAGGDTDIEASTRFIFSRIRLSAHLALHETHAGGEIPSGWLICLFTLVREHESDLLEMYKFYHTEYPLQEIIAYQRELDRIRTGFRWTIPDPLKAKPLHHR